MCPEPSCSIPGEAVVYLNVGSSHTINCTVSSPQVTNQNTASGHVTPVSPLIGLLTQPPDHIFWFFNHRPLRIKKKEYFAIFLYRFIVGIKNFL